MKTWSVQIGPDYHSDTYNGSHDECLEYANALLAGKPSCHIRLAEIEEENGMEIEACQYEDLLVPVEFGGGDSRLNPGDAVDYMLVTVNGQELYAELPAFEDESGNYEALRGLMMEQARDVGCDSSVLRFPYDA